MVATNFILRLADTKAAFVVYTICFYFVYDEQILNPSLAYRL